MKYAKWSSFRACKPLRAAHALQAQVSAATPVYELTTQRRPSTRRSTARLVLLLACTVLLPITASAHAGDSFASKVVTPLRLPDLEKVLQKLNAKQRAALVMSIEGGIVSEAEVVKAGANTEALRSLLAAAWRRHELESAISIAVGSGFLNQSDVERARRNPRFLKDMMRIAANAQLFGLPDAELRKIQDAYSARGGKAGRAAADRLLVTAGLKQNWDITLPEGAFDAVPDPRKLVNAVADMQLTGVSDKKVAEALSDRKFYDKVKSGGLEQAVVGVVFADDPNSPLFKGPDATWTKVGEKFQRKPGNGANTTTGASRGSSAQSGSSSPNRPPQRSGSTATAGTSRTPRTIGYDPTVWGPSNSSGSTSSTGNSSGGSTTNSSPANSGSSGSGSGSGSGSSGSGSSGSGSSGSSGSGSSGSSGSGSSGSGSSGSGSSGSGSSGSGSGSGGSSGGSGGSTAGGSSSGGTGKSGSGTSKGSRTSGGSSSGGSSTGNASSGGGSSSSSPHGGHRWVKDETEKNSDGSTTVVSFFDDGSYVKATYVDGKQVSRTESSSATVTTPTEEIVLTNEAPPPEDDNSGQDVKISGDPSDPDSYNDSKISGVISAALAELMALQLIVHEIRRGGAVDPGREEGAASARGTLIIAPNKLRGLLVGGDGRGSDNGGQYNSVVPPVLRLRDPGNVDPSPDQQ